MLRYLGQNLAPCRAMIVITMPLCITVDWLEPLILMYWLTIKAVFVTSYLTWRWYIWPWIPLDQAAVQAVTSFTYLTITHWNVMSFRTWGWYIGPSRWSCNQPPLFWDCVLLYLRSPKGGCCSISDDLSCSFRVKTGIPPRSGCSADCDVICFTWRWRNQHLLSVDDWDLN